jgi:TRAP-type C4-dicarboxylate transport system permease large subunit
MRVFSLFLLLSGWFVVVSAIALLRPVFVPAFAVAGFAVILLGVVLLCRAHVSMQRGGRSDRRERRY